MVNQSTKERPPYVKKYNNWRIRILYSIIIGYSTFYFCRQNFNIAMPALMEYFDIAKIQVGWILTAASVVYGVGKLLNGFLSDRSNGRAFMVAGLVAVGIITISTTFASNIFLLGFLWILNNWFQSMGWPPATRMLTRWYASKELGTKWSLGATSNQLGGAVTMVICGYLVDAYGWKAAFMVPGIVALLVSLFLYNRLRDSPNEVGLPIVEEYKECRLPTENEDAHLSIYDLTKLIFYNRLMWYICFANMFVYIVRLGIVFWAPLFLYQFKNISIAEAGWHLASYEIVGLIGGIGAGWISDKMFQGRRGPVGTLCMVSLAVTIVLFWQLPKEYEILSLFIITLAGVFASGPQVLIGVATADFTTKQAVGTANGLSGLFGYLGSAVAGICVGWISDNLGWDWVFIFFSLSACAGAAFFFLTWNYNSRKMEIN